MCTFTFTEVWCPNSIKALVFDLDLKNIIVSPCLQKSIEKGMVI